MYLNLFSLSFYTVKGTALFQERSGTDRRIGETRGTGRLKEHKRVRFIALIGNKFGVNAGGPGLLGRWPCVSMLPRKNHMATPTQEGGNEIKGIYGQGSLTFGLEDGSNYLGKPRSGNFRVIRLHRFGGKEDRCYIRTFYVNIQHLIYSNLYSSGCRAGEEAVSERKPRYKVSIVRFGSGFSDKYSGIPGLVQPRGNLGLFLMIKRGWWRMAYKSGATEVAVNRVLRIIYNKIIYPREKIRRGGRDKGNRSGLKLFFAPGIQLCVLCRRLTRRAKRRHIPATRAKRRVVAELWKEGIAFKFCPSTYVRKGLHQEYSNLSKGVSAYLSGAGIILWMGRNSPETERGGGPERSKATGMDATFYHLRKLRAD